MKKLHTIIFVAFASALLFWACIQEEPLNIEADILECTIPDLPKGVMEGAQTIKPGKGSNQIIVQVSSDYTVGELSPQFVLTPGATIVPVSGTLLDFSNEKEQTYVVTSEDGQWKKEYTMIVRPHFSINPEVKSRLFSFDYYQLFDNKYFTFYEPLPSDKKDFIWASGNPGFAITNGTKPADTYPTFAIDAGKSGSAVQLVTRSTGALGALVKKPIAAGNLFLGSFDMSQALTNSLQATKFGIPHTMGEPEKIIFWYKFQGGTFKDKDGVEQQDFPSIYAVLFEPEIGTDGEIIMLNGENVLTADNIISAAELQPEQVVITENIETAEFIQDSIQFVPRKEFDAQKLAEGKYYITIVFSSSFRGDTFEGFVGNTLIVDEVTLITK